MSAAASELPLGNRSSRTKVAHRLAPVDDIGPIQDGFGPLISGRLEDAGFQPRKTFDVIVDITLSLTRARITYP
ncbi:hypothetical protein PYCC9005_004925 [Savitreella phatthalungensis]